MLVSSLFLHTQQSILAFANNTSSRPQVSTTVLNSLIRSLHIVTSVRMYKLPATSSFGGDRSAIATLALDMVSGYHPGMARNYPWDAKSCAAARPMPEEPPANVTSVIVHFASDRLSSYLLSVELCPSTLQTQPYQP